MDETIMTVKEAAIFLRCSQSKIYRMLKNKEIPAFRIGSDWRFSASTLAQWLKTKEIQ
jgi:excisionase family DNA binding protein